MLLPRLRPAARRPLAASIATLQAAFRDPKSPFYIPPGTVGPDAPDAAPPDAAAHARATLVAQGFDAESLWAQPIAWGDHDAFQHVNNVHYVRFFESGRMRWITALGHALGGPAKADAMLRAQGVSLILKSISVKYRRPVTYPDTLLIGHRATPHAAAPRTTFNLVAAAYSFAQRAVVAESEQVIVWYDYTRLRKCDPGNDTWAVLNARMGK